MNTTQYYTQPLYAYLKGKAEKNIPQIKNSPGNLSENEIQSLIKFAGEHNLKINRFKRTNILPRVSKVISFIQGICPRNILDIGSGRGVFLWPLLDRLPDINITSIDTLQHRVNLVTTLHKGGIANLKAFCMSAADMNFADNSFDLVTALEVLEHVPELEKAIAEIYRVSKSYIIISVPSRPDTNPEHIHFIDKNSLLALFSRYNVKKIDISYVHNHMLAIVKK